MSISNNGNGSAFAMPQTRIVSARSIANRRGLSKRARACLAAGWLEGELALRPTAREAARAFGVSVPYVQQARKLPASRRAAIERGDDTYTTLAAPKPKLMLAHAAISDAELESLARKVGADRMLNAAAAAEHHQAA